MLNDAMGVAVVVRASPPLTCVTRSSMRSLCPWARASLSARRARSSSSIASSGSILRNAKDNLTGRGDREG